MPTPRMFPPDLSGGGAMGDRVRRFDWEQTPLGPLQRWPQSLVTAAGITLSAKVPHILTWGTDLTVCAYNDAYQPLLVSRNEPLGRPFLEVWSEARTSLEPLLARVLAGESQHLEAAPFTLIRHGTPEHTFFDFSLLPIRDEAGNIAGVLNSGNEITEEVLAKREREEQLRIIRALAQAVWEAEADGSVVRDAPAWRACSGQTLEQWLREGWLGAVVPEERQHTRAAWQQALTAGRIFNAEARIRTADGSLQWTLLRMSPIRDPRGRVRKWVGVSFDLTRQRQAEEALRQANEKLRTTIDSITDGLLVLDHDWRFVDFSETGARILGMRREDLIGQIVWDMFPDARHRKFHQEYHRAVAGKRPVHFEEFYPEPLNKWLECHCYPSNEGLTVYFRDISERKRAEQALRASETRYRSLFETINEGFCIIEMLFDEQGRASDYRFVEVNPAFERHTGLVNASGKTAREMIPDLELHWFERYGRVATSGEPERFVAQSGALGRWFEVDAFRVNEPQARQVALLFNDVTDRRQAEQALRDSDRRKDEFLATLAHELRNPMAPLQSGLELLRLSSGDASLTARTLPIMERQMVQMRRLVDELLDVSRISRGRITLDVQPVDLNDSILRAVESHRSSLQSGGRRVFVDLPPEPLVVEADPVRLTQIVANLLDNAAKYSAEHGRIWISAARDNDSVRVAVRDDGVGIAPDRLDWIFDMFTQVDGLAGGLGVGLALVRRLVELHGGRDVVRSEGIGRGSEFIVHLPLGEAGEPQPATPRITVAAALTGRSVLVVDDNRDAAESLSLLLETLGARVRTLFDGASALALLDDVKPDIVFLDIGMPGLDGYQVARKIRASPAARHCLLVAVTGWGQAEDRRLAAAAGFDRHLVKPAALADLQQALVDAPQSRSAL